jgi:hypothetical protein
MTKPNDVVGAKWDVSVEVGRYENGTIFHRVSLGGTILGTVDEAEGGFLPANHRKPSPTLREAVRRLVLSRAKQAKSEHERLLKAADSLDDEG